MKKVIVTIIGFMGVIAAVLLICTHVLNISNIEDRDRDVDSYHPLSPLIYLFAGIVLVITSLGTFLIHPVAGMLPFITGLGLFIYGAYLELIMLGVL